MEKLEYLNELQVAAEKLIHSYGVLFLVTLFLKWVASFAAILLLILDGTKWKSINMRTSLLAPCLFVTLPLVVFQFLRTEFMKWIALLTVVFKIFLPNHFPESLEVPSATFLLTVAAPSFFIETFRDNQGMIDPMGVCFLVSLYLHNDYTKACGGCKNPYTQKDKIPYAICLHLLYIYSLWSLCVNPYLLDKFWSTVN